MGSNATVQTELQLEEKEVLHSSTDGPKVTLPRSECRPHRRLSLICHIISIVPEDEGEESTYQLEVAQDISSRSELPQQLCSEGSHVDAHRRCPSRTQRFGQTQSKVWSGGELGVWSLGVEEPGGVTVEYQQSNLDEVWEQSKVSRDRMSRSKGTYEGRR